MRVSKLSEYGYEEAALGVSLSYNSTVERSKQILYKLSWGVPGEDKYLESIMTFWDVTAPRFWWQEADTYRLSTKQSESTMHTIMKRELTANDFEGFVPSSTINYLNDKIRFYKILNSSGEDVVRIKKDTFFDIKSALPEGFLQRRIWLVSYKTLKGIITQRMKHRLPQWKLFCETVLSTVEHPEFLVKETK